ncbi:GTP cyclohydrolase II [Azospirillum oleiclasticum]|nr:GTP cyclohydrolase II [Azospirillum oleiclasticum]
MTDPTPPMYADLHSIPPHPLDEAALRTVDRAVAAMRRGEPVAVEGTDGSLCVALSVEMATSDSLARLKRTAGGEPVLAVTRRRAVVLNAMQEGTGVVTFAAPGGLCADDARALADPELRRGVALPAGLVAAVSEPGTREAAAVELARLGRLLPAAVVAPVTLRGDGIAWAQRRDLLHVRALDVTDYRTHAARTLRRVAQARVPLELAEATEIVAFRPADGGPEHLAIVIGSPDPAEPVLARLHSECFTGDLLGSLRCDCGDQLRGAIAEIARAGSGVLLYLAQEGRGIGLVNKLRAYRIQDAGFDTVDANEMLGFEADERVYLPAAEMLRQLGFGRVRLMTNNPDKLRELARCGIEVVERVPHVFPTNGHNEGYLRTKAERSGHMF